MTRFAVLLPILVCLGAGNARAFEQPPIQSPEDQACRDEAVGKVFDTPDPQGLGAHAIGKRIYFACMQRLQGPVGSSVPPRRSGKAA